MHNILLVIDKSTMFRTHQRTELSRHKVARHLMEKRTLFTAIIVVQNPVSEVLCISIVLQSVCCICLRNDSARVDCILYSM